MLLTKVQNSIAESNRATRVPRECRVGVPGWSAAGVPRECRESAATVPVEFGCMTKWVNLEREVFMYNDSFRDCDKGLLEYW